MFVRCLLGLLAGSTLLTALLFLPAPCLPAADPATPVPAYRLDTVAGTGQPGFAGDGGPAVEAKLQRPTAVDIDPSGNIYIADYGNNRIRRITPAGMISTFAGTGEAGFSGDGGPATAAKLSGPYGVRADGRGNVYIGDARNGRVRKVAADGTISTVAGDGRPAPRGDDGPATAASLTRPDDMQIDAAGNLYIADAGANQIRKVTPDGIIHTVAGTARPRATGESAYSGDGGPATAARLNVPGAVALDRAGNLYIADLRNHAVRKVGSDGVIHTVAGTGKAGFSGDGGPAAAAQLREPGGLAFGRGGELWIADGVNYRLRQVTPDGRIRTLAGIGKRGNGGSGVPALSADLGVLDILAVDGKGTVYFVDHSNHRVRKLTSTTGGS